jgi:hypothetical protein
MPDPSRHDPHTAFLDAATKAAALLDIERPLADPLDWHRAARRLVEEPVGLRAGRWPLLDRLEQRLRSADWQYDEQVARLIEAVPDLALPVPALPKRRILYIAHFDVLSLNGGAIRILGLARALQAWAHVTILSVVGSRRTLERIRLGPACELICIPQSAAFVQAVRERESGYARAAHALALAEAPETLPMMAYWMDRFGRDADLIILNQPYLIDTWLATGHDRPLVYDMPEINHFFIRRLAEGGARIEAALDTQRRVETAACHQARVVHKVSGSDAEALVKQLVDPALANRILHVPNGVDVARCFFTTPQDAARVRAACGCIQRGFVFVGTPGYPPNEAAVRTMAGLARGWPERLFLVIGMRPEESPTGLAVPANLLFLGRLSDRMKSAVFSLCDIALAPMVADSGSSLKVPDYLAHGKRVVTTAFGLRGFPELAPHVHAADEAAFDSVLREVDAVCSGRPADFDEPARAALAVVRELLDWPSVVARMLDGWRAHGIWPEEGEAS